MAERQSAHRESMEARVVDGNMTLQRQGSVFGFIIAMAAILGGIYLIHDGKSASGLTAIVGSLTALVSVFFYSKYQQRKERVEKAVALDQRRSAGRQSSK